MANYYRIGAGSLNWSNVGSWSSTSGGASNGSAEPTSSDNVYFDTNSPTSVTVAATANCNNLSLNKASLVITTNASLTIANTLTIVLGITFSGTNGFTTATLLCDATGALTISFKESVTYTVTTLLSCYKSRLGSVVLFTSSHASTKANILMPNNGNNSCNILASFTRIDASGGRTICTFGGVVTDCVNVQSYTDRQTFSK